MLGELLRIPVAGDDVAQNPEAGHAGDVAHDQRELDVHLDQRFLHALDQSARVLDEGRAVPEIAAQRDDPIDGAETPAEQPEDVQISEPFAIGDITLATREVLRVARIDEHYLKAAGLEDLVERDPIYAGGLHRHVRHPTRGEPGGEAVQIPGEGRKGANGGRVAIGWHGDEVFCRATVDAGGVRMQTFQRIRRGERLRGRTTTIAFPQRLLYTFGQPPGTGMRMRGNLLNGITPIARRVTNDDAANPRTTLTLGLLSTSAGSASVPGGS